MNNKVSVGPTTILGITTAVTAFAGAFITYLTGDHSAQTITSVEAAGAGLVVLLLTLGARYLQAHKMIGLANISKSITKEDVEKIVKDVVTVASNPKEASKVFDQAAEVVSNVVSNDEELANQPTEIVTPSAPNPAQTPAVNSPIGG